MKTKLMNKWTSVFGTAAILMMALTLTSASANDKQKKTEQHRESPPVVQTVPGKPAPGKVALACQQDGISDVTAKVKITNTTGQTIPKGTKIFWQTNKGLKASFAVYDADGLQPNESIKDSNGDESEQGPCTAYFIKK
ncbi:MAG TPA: hypothetical protein PKC13_24485 [Blastocatellia bacterium]|nr:hypothetical protein [Blastocatellia bacterium]HMV87475.1 hypothetical protein [Blastocatellia bacterium]HMX28767.1 hypothetical protein [Blastocatellia bacterium]HMY73910.1 hypothetical protein [Blastocatellia bacterium]HNG33359.1 hypothetical protein [Blastocatellia bacterium]